MGLVAHIKNECELLLKQDGADSLTQQYHDAIIEAGEAFAKDGMFEHQLIVMHALELFKRACMWLPLSSLKSIEEAPEDWALIGCEDGEQKTYQNRRCNRVFYYEDDKRYCDVDTAVFTEPDSGVYYTTGAMARKYQERFKDEMEIFNLYPCTSAKDVTMPYWPETERAEYKRYWWQSAIYEVWNAYGVEMDKLPENSTNAIDEPPRAFIPKVVKQISISRLYLGYPDELFLLMELHCESGEAIPIIYHFEHAELPGSLDYQKELMRLKKSVDKMAEDLFDNPNVHLFVFPCKEHYSYLPALNMILPFYQYENWSKASIHYQSIIIDEDSVDKVDFDMNDPIPVPRSMDMIEALLRDANYENPDAPRLTSQDVCSEDTAHAGYLALQYIKARIEHQTRKINPDTDEVLRSTEACPEPCEQSEPAE